MLVLCQRYWCFFISVLSYWRPLWILGEEWEGVSDLACVMKIWIGRFSILVKLNQTVFKSVEGFYSTSSRSQLQFPPFSL